MRNEKGPSVRLKHYAMTPERWADQVAGSGCPFCLPRVDENEFWGKISKLSRSTLYLSRDQRYPGRCLLVWDGAHVVGMGALAKPCAHALLDDLLLSGAAIEKATRCELLNKKGGIPRRSGRGMIA